MAEMYLKRTLSGLIADDADAVDSLRRIPLGVTVRCEIVKPRSVRQLRYYWSLCNLCSMNSDQFKSKEQVDQALRILTGHTDLVQLGDQVLQIPRRIAFSQLSQDDWVEFLKRAKDAVLEHILPGVAMPELESELAAMAS